MGSVGSWTEVNSKSVKKTWGYTECKGSLNDLAPLSDPGTAGNKDLKKVEGGVSEHLQKFLKQRRHQKLIG